MGFSHSFGYKKMNVTEEKLRQMVETEVDLEGLILVDMILARHKGSVSLRILADKPGGITVGECAKLSRKLGIVLDNDEVFPGKYILEVSSPGLTRPLTNALEFGLKIGENIRLFYSDGDEAEKVTEGKLEAVVDNCLTMTTSDGPFKIELDKVSKGKIIL